ncbi:hypothetical protein HJFPF1_07973 [Paramyrothecium foliicola]|nr:hypothetical protein HJFPF1_07973 [Paramyrothecium foliicola]
MALAIFQTAASKGVGMVVLQVLRVLSVISLTAAIVSCWLLILKIDKDRSWFPFEGASLFFLSCLPIFLIVSEFPVIRFLKNYFERTWPAVGPKAGLGWLGTGMVVVGCNLLGKLNQAAFDSKKMGDPFRQLVMAAGILNLIFGVLNVLCTFIWGDRKSDISAREVRSKGSLAEANKEYLPKYTPDDYSSRAPSTRKEKARSKFISMFWKGDGTERPNISGPMPTHQDFERTSYDEERASPIVPGVKRPDTALHPMNVRTSSRYSDANMSRF